jgi:hypothetical protein
MPPEPLVTGREHRVSDLTNEEFLLKYAKAGCVGLSGGLSIVDRAICRAERHVIPRERWGAWSHAFLFEGVRADGQHWVIESDLQVHRKHIQLGVQENRISKYFDQEYYSNLAIVDFGLTESQTAAVIGEALNHVADRTRYSLRELFGTLIALHKPPLRSEENVLERERSMYCSAFIQHLFSKAGLDLAPGIHIKNTTPEDIARTPVPHTIWIRQRGVPTSSLQPLKARLRRLQARGRLVRKKLKLSQGNH